MNGILRRPWLVASVALAVAGVFGVLLSRLRIDPNIEHLLPADDPTLQITRHLQGDSPPSRVLFVILRADEPGALEEAVPVVAERLRGSVHLASVAATRLEFAGARAEWVRKSPLHFLPQETLERLKARLTGPERRVELESTLRRMAEDPFAGRRTAVADPLGLRWIFDEAAQRLGGRFPAKLRSGTPYLIVDQPPVAFLRALGREDSTNTDFSRALLADVRGRLAVGKVQVELAGGYISAETQEAALKRDIIVESVVSTLAVMAFVAWFTRSLLAAHLVFVPVILATAGSLALGGTFFGPLTPIVACAGAILIAQGIDFPMHLFTRFRGERATRGRDEALHAAQSGMVRPFLGILVTTLAAFLALLTSRFPGLRELGFVLSSGLLLCVLAALLLFPVLLMPLDRLVRPATERTPWVVGWAGRIYRSSWRRWVALVLTVAGIAAWGAVAWKGVRMDLDVRNAIAPGDPGLAALERLENDLGASMTPVVALPAAHAPDELRSRLERLQREGAIAAADGLPHLLPGPEERERAARFLKETEGWLEGSLADLIALGFRPEPFREGLEEIRRGFAAPAPSIGDLERPEFASLRRTLIYGERPVLYLSPVRSLWSPEERTKFDGAARAALGADTSLYSAFHFPDHYSRVLDGDLRRIVVLTSVGIVVMTLLSIGSFRDGLCALVPVFLATGITLAAAVLLGGRINVINMAAVPIILAIGVDGGVHFMCRFREGNRRDPAATIAEVGPGIWGSGATTLLGFGSIATSVTPGMASMGLLVVAGTITSVLATLFLLPGLVKARV